MLPPVTWLTAPAAGSLTTASSSYSGKSAAAAGTTPSSWTGPGGEIWKLEDNVYDLITLTEQVLSDDPLFFAINSYTEGLSPAVMEYIVKTTLCPIQGGHTHCDEIGLPVSATGGVVPCGATAIWEK